MLLPDSTFKSVINMSEESVPLDLGLVGAVNSVMEGAEVLASGENLAQEPKTVSLVPSFTDGQQVYVVHIEEDGVEKAVEFVYGAGVDTDNGLMTVDAVTVDSSTVEEGQTQVAEVAVDNLFNQEPSTSTQGQSGSQNVTSFSTSEGVQSEVDQDEPKLEIYDNDKLIALPQTNNHQNKEKLNTISIDNPTHIAQSSKTDSVHEIKTEQNLTEYQEIDIEGFEPIKNDCFSKEDTKEFISLVEKNAHLFAKYKNVVVWNALTPKLNSLTGKKFTAMKLLKKWGNLRKNYKAIKESGKTKKTTWEFFSLLEKLIDTHPHLKGNEEYHKGRQRKKEERERLEREKEEETDTEDELEEESSPPAWLTSMISAYHKQMDKQSAEKEKEIHKHYKVERKRNKLLRQLTYRVNHASLKALQASQDRRVAEELDEIMKEGNLT